MPQNTFVVLVNTLEIEKETCMETRKRENGKTELRISKSEETVA